MRATITRSTFHVRIRIAAQLPALRLKRNEDRRLHAGHLWVFSNEVDTQQTPLPKFKPGELVRVLAHNDRALGLAYVNPTFAHQRPHAGDLDASRCRAGSPARIRAALALRERLYRQPYYRVVYGESDGLPGLVMDRYGAALRGANRHRRDGASQAADPRGGPAGARVRGAAVQERRPARASSRACRAMSRRPRAGSATRGRVIEDGLKFRCRSPRAKRPAGSSTRPRIGVR